MDTSLRHPTPYIDLDSQLHTINQYVQTPRFLHNLPRQTDPQSYFHRHMGTHAHTLILPKVL